jgi:transcriptional regulator with XRE-family HTH domain
LEEQMEAFRRRLRERRVEVGLSARALGLAIGKGNSYVQSLESGLRGRDLPDYGTIVKLAQKLDCDPEWLARGRGQGPAGPPAPAVVPRGQPHARGAVH